MNTTTLTDAMHLQALNINLINSPDFYAPHALHLEGEPVDVYEAIRIGCLIFYDGPGYRADHFIKYYSELYRDREQIIAECEALAEANAQ